MSVFVWGKKSVERGGGRVDHQQLLCQSTFFPLITTLNTLAPQLFVHYYTTLINTLLTIAFSQSPKTTARVDMPVTTPYPATRPNLVQKKIGLVRWEMVR